MQVEVHSVVQQEWRVVPVQVRLAYLRTPAEAVSALEQEVPMAQWRVVQVEAHSVVQQEWWVVPVQVRLAYLRTPAAVVSVLEQEVPMAQW